jgi:hypothetical protein
VASNYRGPCEIEFAGIRYSGLANLRARDGTFDGRLMSDDADWFAIQQQGATVKVHLPSGKVGEVIVTHASLGESHVRVQGTGPVPF